MRPSHRLQWQIRRCEVKPASSGQVSELLFQCGNGDRKGLDAVLPLVYDELRRQAHYHLKKAAPESHYAERRASRRGYMRFAEKRSLQEENRAHFVGIAAQLRWILVDYERRRAPPSEDLESFD